MREKTYSRPIFIYRATHTGTMLSLTYFTGVKNWKLSSWAWNGVVDSGTSLVWVVNLIVVSGSC